MSKLVVYIPLMILAFVLACSESKGNESNDCQIFVDTDEAEAKRIGAQLSAQHQKEGKSLGYRRHRLAGIDVPCLLSVLNSNTEDRRRGAVPHGVAIELFEDFTVEVVVDDWIEKPADYDGNFTSGYGRPVGDYALNANFVIHYQENGALSASLFLDSDSSFLIESIQNSTLYRIVEVDPPDRID